MIYYVILIGMTLIGAIASMFFKRAASGSKNIKEIFKNINLYIGGFLYVLAAFLNIWLLRILEYSVAVPMTAITYMWTMVISYFFLNEKITKRKIVGVGMIILGAVMVAVN